MKVGIIGAGASGLFLATKLEQMNIDYMLFNAGKVGRKILASGNGRCNIAHKGITLEDYLSNIFAYQLVQDTEEAVFSHFQALKIYTKCDSEGRMYPISESSQSVLDQLLKNIKTKITDLEIKSIYKNKNQYYLNNCYGPFDKIILATGSIASFKRPYLSMDYLKDLDVKMNPFTPSLVGFTTMRKIKPMSGARQKCHASLLQDHKIIHEEDGEIIFKDNGISGIVIMNLSSYYAHLPKKRDCFIQLDFSYGKDYDDYSTIIHPKILKYLNENSIPIHSFTMPISGTYDFEFAQVCKGGIDLGEINSNLSLKKDKNIYAMGEILDCDGVCGGYNLLFAFSSAIKVAKELEHEISNQ